MTVNSQVSTYLNQMVATEAGKSITYSLISGSLPGGTTLSTNGLIVGQFTDNVSNSAIYNFRLRATDSDGQSVDQDFSLTVAESDGLFGNVVLQFNGDSAYPISTGNAANSNTIIRINNQPIASTMSPYSNYWSIPLRNNGDYVTFFNNGSGLIDFGTGQFTVEAWIYQLVDNAYLFTSTVSGTNYFVINTGLTGLYLTATPSGGGTSIGGGNISLRQWTHVAVVREGTGTNQTNLFINGTQVASGTVNMNITTAYTPTLGAYTHVTTDPFTFRGYINNFRVSNIARYTGSFNPSVTPFTPDNNTLGQLSRIIDFRHKGTPKILPTFPNYFGSTTITPFNPLGNYYANSQVGSTFFIRGKSNFVDYGTVNLGTDPYTIEFWHMPKDGTSSGLFSIKDLSSNVGVDFGLDPGGVTYTSNTTINYLLSAASLYTPNAWNHFALVRNGSTVKLFLNGSNVNQITNTAYSADLIGNLYIGFSPTIGYATGHIADFRVTKGIVYTGNTLPPQDSLQLGGNSLIYPSSANVNTTFPESNTLVLTLQTKYSYSNRVVFDDGDFALTPNTFGNVTVGTFSPFSDGWSQYYDGNGDTLSFAANTAFAMGTGDFTVESWVNFSNVLLSYNPICQSDAIGSSGNDKWWFGHNAGNLWLNCHSSGGFNSRTPFNPVSGTWYHVAAQRRSGNLRMYINGTEYNPVITTGNPNNYNLGQNGFVLGGISSPYYLQGYLSSFRLIKGQAIYTGNFVPVTTALSISQTARTNVEAVLNTTTTLLLNDYAFQDKSLNNFAVTRNGDVRISNYSPFQTNSDYAPDSYGGSVYFPGDGYIQPSLEPDNEATAYYSDNFSLECWYYLLATPGTQYIISKWGSSNKEIVLGIGCYAVAGKTGFTYTIDGGNDRGLYDPGTCFPYQWTHVAVAKTGSTMSLYVNGFRKDTRTETGNLFNSSQITRIGAHSDGGPSAYFPGYVSGLRSTVGYSPYDANSTIISFSTSPAVRIPGTRLLMTGNPYSLIDYSRKNNLLNLGNVRVVSHMSKFGRGSLAFDGNINDYVTMPDNDQLEFEADNFTIEAWVYPTILFGGLKPIFGHGTNNTNFMSFHVTSLGALSLTIQSAGTNLVSITSTNTIAAETWTHVALVRNGSSFNIFIGGVQSPLSGSPQTFAGAIPNYTDSFRIGFGRYSGESGAYFQGYMDDYRITKGIARYTLDFAPPTRRFGVR
ncbi:MAG: LamG domain-containing protein [Proteobacteria bacterium]|nr:LamG domain-containing protein [Pseudomonadota bacterium]